MRLFVTFFTLLQQLCSTLPVSANAIPTAESLLHSNRSLLAPANWYPVCVSSIEHPSWSGPIGSIHCTSLLVALKDLVNPFGEKPYTFYSPKSVKNHPKDDISLPTGFSYGELLADHENRCSPYNDLEFNIVGTGDCALILRMAKDFGDDVLPLRTTGFFPGSLRKPVEENNWPDIMAQIETLVSICAWRAIPSGPGWARIGSDMVVLLLPADSEMHKRWLLDDTTSSIVDSAHSSINRNTPWRASRIALIPYQLSDLR